MKPLRLRHLPRLLLCTIGWHEYTWKLRRHGVIVLRSDPPPDARCRHCNIRFRKEPHG